MSREAQREAALVGHLPVDQPLQVSPLLRVDIDACFALEEIPLESARSCSDKQLS